MSNPKGPPLSSLATAEPTKTQSKDAVECLRMRSAWTVQPQVLPAVNVAAHAGSEEEVKDAAGCWNREDWARDCRPAVLADLVLSLTAAAPNRPWGCLPGELFVAADGYSSVRMAAPECDERRAIPVFVDVYLHRQT